MLPASSVELMTIVAARMLRNSSVCLVGIGLPSKAANFARLTHAPDIVLVYESGTIGTQPHALPLSIGDEDLADQALTLVSTFELFQFWIQGGRIDTAFLGAAQVDKFANLNSTVIGEYRSPDVRLPGSGGAPEIAAHAAQTLVMIQHDRRKLVERVDFVSTVGYLDGGNARPAAGLTGGPAAVITDLAVLRPEATTQELVVTQLHPGVSRQRVLENTGWKVRFATDLRVTDPPSKSELQVLRHFDQESQNLHAARSRDLDLRRFVANHRDPTASNDNSA